MTQVFQLCKVIVWRRLVSNMITHVGNVVYVCNDVLTKANRVRTTLAYKPLAKLSLRTKIKIIPYWIEDWIAISMEMENPKFLTRFSHFLFFFFRAKNERFKHCFPSSFPPGCQGKGFATLSNNKTAINCLLYNVTLCTSAGHLPTPLLLQITFYK